jgi:hypothetical protein
MNLLKWVEIHRCLMTYLMLSTAPFWLSACATSRTYQLESKDIHQKEEPTAQELFSSMSAIGQSTQSVKGTAWLKTKSSEVSGQFSASALATTPGQLKLEVTNIFGGTEATIEIRDRHYEIIGFRGKAKKKAEGYGSWGGLPLEWATELFLGRVPAPGKKSRPVLSLGAEGELIVRVPPRLGVDEQEFIYRFTRVNGAYLPHELHWKRLGVPVAQIDFSFDQFDEETGSPKKWEAHSPQGTVKVLWRKRIHTLNPSRPDDLGVLDVSKK